MGVGAVHTADLDAFVVEYDDRHRLDPAAAAAWLADFELRHDTQVDVSLDGFSDEYRRQQLALYREISGRDLDQEVNELLDLWVPSVVDHVNPYNSDDPQRVAHHARTILTTILVADLPPAARVLDMGCGWGISSEMFAYSGCEVTAVDVNADLLAAVQQRAAVRNYPITTVHSTFDAFTADTAFDLVFFFECLHHAVDVAALLGRLADNVAPGGKIAVAGEPIQATWWPTWGMRLDPVSVHDMRKLGWFESGWSESHLRACFERAGFELTMMTGIGLYHSAIGVAVRAGDDVAVPSPHWATPRDPDAPPPEPPPTRSAVERAARAVGRRVFGA
ncbi:MAG: class I SAM-dependent methyltransferase [Actinomycetota bacterium]